MSVYRYRWLRALPYWLMSAYWLVDRSVMGLVYVYRLGSCLVYTLAKGSLWVHMYGLATGSLWVHMYGLAYEWVYGLVYR